jgi:pilus assembly protein TadC
MTPGTASAAAERMIATPAASDAATPLAAVTVLLAVAVLLADAPSGRLRLRSLAAPAPATVAPDAALRPGWVAVGAAALGGVAFAVSGVVAATVVTALAAAAGVVAMRRAGRPADPDSGALAGRWELLAVCLEAGLPVAAAVSATAAPLDGTTGTLLRRVAGLLELGADPADAWRGATELPALASFARAAGRSAGTGAALAQVARVEGSRLRAELIDTAQARAQRAAVLITGPLGLCFLPAFLTLGIAPVVVGLAGEALARW